MKAFEHYDIFKSFEMIHPNQSGKKTSRNTIDIIQRNSFNSKLDSHEEIIYDLITEIPHYFQTDAQQAYDDMELLQSKRKCNIDKHDRSSKSFDKNKTKQGIIRRKAILLDEKPTINITKKNKCDVTYNLDGRRNSNFEQNLEREEAYFVTTDGCQYPGIGFVSDYRFRFEFYDDKTYEKLRLTEDFFSYPLFSIAKLEKYFDRKEPGKYFIDIQTKDFRKAKFKVINEDLKLFWILFKLAFPQADNNFYLFAFTYCGNYKLTQVNGWKIYNIKKELDRLGVDYKGEKSKYRLSVANKNFSICQTYPKYVIVPRFFSDDELWECCNHRNQNRFPVLSWQYSVNKCCLWRSSQCKGGLLQQRSASDEKLLRMMGDFSDKLIIFDARPYINAFTNKFKGAGFENPEYYSKCELKFCDIDNIHAVRSSYAKVYALLSNDKQKENKKYLSMLEQTGWLDFVSTILKASHDISSSIKTGCTVLVHCSDGWDRTPQLTSTVQVLLDPYFRTLEGFTVLIEKEWLSFGHPFAHRNGHYTQQLSEDQKSPIFLQWLDCIHQLLFQFPHAFEFNTELLLFISSHLFSCKYGTFLFNCENDRNIFDAKHRTISIWTNVLDEKNKSKFINPFYLKENSKELTPNYGISKLRIWEEYFLQFEIGENIVKLKLPNLSNEDVMIKNSVQLFEKIRTDDLNCIKKKNEFMKTIQEAIKELYSELENNHLVDEISSKAIDEVHTINGIKCEQYEIISPVKEEAEPCSAVIKETLHIVENYLDK